MTDPASPRPLLTPLAQRQWDTFELNDRVLHRFYGPGVIKGILYVWDVLYWRVQFEHFGAVIPTRDLKAIAKEQDNGKSNDRGPARNVQPGATRTD